MCFLPELFPTTNISYKYCEKQSSIFQRVSDFELFFSRFAIVADGLLRGSGHAIAEAGVPGWTLGGPPQWGVIWFPQPPPVVSELMTPYDHSSWCVVKLLPMGYVPLVPIFQRLLGPPQPPLSSSNLIPRASSNLLSNEVFSEQFEGAYFVRTNFDQQAKMNCFRSRNVRCGL